MLDLLYEASGSDAVAGFDVARALRRNEADSPRITRTPGVAGNRKTWTVSGWFKRGKLTLGGGSRALFGAWLAAATDSGYFVIATTHNADTIQISGYATVWRTSNLVLRDPTDYFNMVVAADSTQAVADDRLKVWINNVRVTSWSTNNAVPLNHDFAMNGAGPHDVGYSDPAAGGSVHGDFLISEIAFVDGLQLDPTYFGEYPTGSDQWRPKKITLTSAQWGLCGSYLDFSDNSSLTTLGYDRAPTGTGHAAANNWTLTNFSVTAGVGNDSLIDTPTNNFCVLSTVDKLSAATLTNCGLDFSCTAGDNTTRGTMAIPPAGKIYFEFLPTTIAGGSSRSPAIGICKASAALTTANPGVASIAYTMSCANGNKRYSATAAYGSAFNGTTDIGMCAINLATGKIWWGKNGTWFASGDPAAGTNEAFSGISAADAWLPCVTNEEVTTVAGSFNFGQRPFSYSAPSGFVALCTKNMPEPAIKQPSAYMQALTYTAPKYLIGDETRITAGSRTVSKSLRFNDDDSARFTRTMGASGDSMKFTWSGWVRRANLGTEQVLIGAQNGGLYWDHFYFDTLDRLSWKFDVGTAAITGYTRSIFRDCSRPIHVQTVVDMAQATAALRVRIWVDGVQYPIDGSIPAQNYSTRFNVSGNTLGIGTEVHYAVPTGPGRVLDGHLSEVHFIDGTALDPSYFREVNGDGIGVPKTTASLTSANYGANGYYLDFSDNSAATAAAIGKDVAPTGTGHSAANNWTPTNISVTAGTGNDSSTDTPTTIYDALDVFRKGSGVTLSEGNLRAFNGAADYSPAIGTMVMASKTYVEFTAGNATVVDVGLISSAVATPAIGNGARGGNSTGLVGYRGMDGGVYLETVSQGTYSTITTNDVVMLAYDPATGKLWIGKNGTWFNSGNPNAGTGQVATVPASWRALAQVYFLGYVSSAAGYYNAGQRAFAYTVPTGFAGHSTANLPVISDANLFFKGGSPALLWGKGRSGATHHKLVDTTRGLGLNLEASSAAAETGEATIIGVNKFGIRLGDDADINTAAATYALWAWRKGVTPGFDIVPFVGNATNRTIAHTLGVKPAMMLVRRRVTAAGYTAVWHQNMNAAPSGGYLHLESNDNFSVNAAMWNSTDPTPSVFSLGTNGMVNNNAEDHIAYVWAEIAGFSKFGTYVGNNSTTDGPFVYCGFRPRLIITKSISTGGASYDWAMIDTARSDFNISRSLLLANGPAAQDVTANADMDILSNGFKPRYAPNATNGPNTYIFAAFAELPGKYSRAR